MGPQRRILKLEGMAMKEESWNETEIKTEVRRKHEECLKQNPKEISL